MAPPGSTILDVRKGKIFAASYGYLHYIDTATRAIITLPYPTNYTLTSTSARITDEGVYFAGIYSWEIYSWKPGNMPVQLRYRPKEVAYGGNAVAWTSEYLDTLYYKASMDAPVQMVATDVDKISIDRDGTLFYAGRDHSLNRFANGVAERIYYDFTNNRDVDWMIADRGQIAYNTLTGGGGWHLRLYNNGSAPLLMRTDHMYSYFTQDKAKLDSGRLAWMNYRTLDPKIPAGLYLKLPGDTARVIYDTILNRFGGPLAIGPRNDVLVNTGVGSQIDYVPANGGRRTLGSGWNRFFNNDGKWFVSQQHVLFRLDTTANNNFSAANRTVAVKYKTARYLSAKEFASMYSGPQDALGRLEQVQITQHPGSESCTWPTAWPRPAYCGATSWIACITSPSQAR